MDRGRARNAGRKGGQVSRGGRGRLIVPSDAPQPETTSEVRGGKSCGMTRSIERTLWRRLTMARRVAVICVLTLAVAASARAQSGSSGTSTGQSTTATQASSSSTAEETRPATTTFFGDTGLWFVPTAEVLAKGQWSASVYRRGTNWVQGYTNVADFAGTFAYGFGGRAEVFGSFLVDTRIDRDIRRSSSTIPPSAASSIATPRSIRTGPATTSATSTLARSTTSGRNPVRIRRRSPSAA